MIELYTDGSYSIPRGVGKWAVVVVKNNKCVDKLSEQLINSTSNRAELTALIKALEYAKDKDSVTVYSDSKYVVRGYNEWVQSWKKDNWQNFNGKPTKNADLWKQIYELKKKSVVVKWVKGHDNNEFNELADQIAGNY